MSYNGSQYLGKDLPCAPAAQAVIWMKKRLLSAALVLLLMLLILPAACADLTYSDPAPLELGAALDHLAATTAPGSDVRVIEGMLPPGVELETEEQEDTLYVYLRGVPTAAGEFTSVISLDDGNRFIRTITVRPATPTVSASADVRCYPNQAVQVAVSASAPDGGSLSYQWFTGADRSSSGGAEIAGATGAVYQPGTAYVGTSYYYCLVTNSADGVSTSVYSPAIAVTVEEVSLTAISVESRPTKTEYTVGDTLDTRGLQVRASFSNGSEQLLTEGFGVYPTRLDTAGEQRIEISYQGLICDFTVKVSQAEEVIEGIGVLTLPTKTEYTVGESLNPAGLSIRAYTNNGHRDVTQEFLSCEPQVLTKTGSQTITVSYGGKTCTFTVNVQEAEAVSSVSIFRMPDKVTYTVGDALDTSGMVLRLVTNLQNTRDVSDGYTCTPSRLTQEGRQEITVRYGDVSTRYYVTVAAAASASPSPSPSAVPSPGPTASPGVPDLTAVSPSPAPGSVSPAGSSASRSAGIGRTLVAVIVIAALLALAVLGVYVYIMNRGGYEVFFEKIRQLFHREK